MCLHLFYTSDAYKIWVYNMCLYSFPLQTQYLPSPPSYYQPHTFKASYNIVDSPKSSNKKHKKCTAQSDHLSAEKSAYALGHKTDEALLQNSIFTAYMRIHKLGNFLQLQHISTLFFQILSNFQIKQECTLYTKFCIPSVIVHFPNKN